SQTPQTPRGAFASDDAGYLIVDEAWHILAVDDTSSLIGESSPNALLGQHAGDVLGTAALLALAQEGMATFTLENIVYVLTVRTFELPGGRIRMIRAQEMEATLDHVVSLLVHEVRNPLSAMRALVQGLEEVLEDRLDARPYTNRLTGEIDRLNRLLLSMSQVARLRARPPDLLQPADLLERVAAIYRHGLAQ